MRCVSIVVGLFSLGCVADLVGTPVCLRKSGPDLFLVGRILRMMVVGVMKVYTVKRLGWSWVSWLNCCSWEEAEVC